MIAFVKCWCALAAVICARNAVAVAIRLLQQLIRRLLCINQCLANSNNLVKCTIRIKASGSSSKVTILSSKEGIQFNSRWVVTQSCNSNLEVFLCSSRPIRWYSRVTQQTNSNGALPHHPLAGILTLRIRRLSSIHQSTKLWRDSNSVRSKSHRVLQ